MAPFTKSEQFELWTDLATQNRHLRRNNWAHWVIHLVLVASLMLLALRPLVAVRVDQLGAAQLVSTVATSNEPLPEEAEHVSRLIAGYLLEVNSGSVARDIGKATTLMTSPFARVYLAKVKGDPTLALVEKGNVRTVLTFDPDPTKVDITKEADKSGHTVRYFVTLSGRLDIYRADVNTTPLLTKYLHIRTTLLVVPRTSNTLNGLLVEFFEKTFYEPTTAPTLNVAPLPTATKEAQ